MMKCKRFIKLMQSKGLPRNKATKLAKIVSEFKGVGLSYKSVSAGKVYKIDKNEYCYYPEGITGEDLQYFLRKRSALLKKQRGGKPTWSILSSVPITIENEHSHYPTNCKNCGAPLHGHICKFCDTEYN